MPNNTHAPEFHHFNLTRSGILYPISREARDSLPMEVVMPKVTVDMIRHVEAFGDPETASVRFRVRRALQVTVGFPAYDELLEREAGVPLQVGFARNDRDKDKQLVAHKPLAPSVIRSWQILDTELSANHASLRKGMAWNAQTRTELMAALRNKHNSPFAIRVAQDAAEAALAAIDKAAKSYAGYASAIQRAASAVHVSDGQAVTDPVRDEATAIAVHEGRIAEGNIIHQADIDATRDAMAKNLKTINANLKAAAVRVSGASPTMVLRSGKLTNAFVTNMLDGSAAEGDEILRQEVAEFLEPVRKAILRCANVAFNSAIAVDMRPFSAG